MPEALRLGGAAGLSGPGGHRRNEIRRMSGVRPCVVLGAVPPDEADASPRNGPPHRWAQARRRHTQRRIRGARLDAMGSIRDWIGPTANLMICAFTFPNNNEAKKQADETGAANVSVGGTMLDIFRETSRCCPRWPY